MGFADRARSMHARGDMVRAAVILVEGLKKHPEEEEALEWLLNVYIEELPNPGIESDILGVLARQDNGYALFELLQAELRASNEDAKLEALTAMHDRLGYPQPMQQHVETPAHEPLEPARAESVVVSASGDHTVQPSLNVETEEPVAPPNSPVGNITLLDMPEGVEVSDEERAAYASRAKRVVLIGGVTIIALIVIFALTADEMATAPHTQQQPEATETSAEPTQGSPQGTPAESAPVGDEARAD